MNPRPLLEAHGIDPHDLKFGRQIDAKDFAAVLEFGAREIGDDHFGLHRGGAFDIKNGGVLAYLAACSETVGEAIDGFQRYASVVCDGFSAELKRDHTGVLLSLRASDPT